MLVKIGVDQAMAAPPPIRFNNRRRLIRSWDTATSCG